MQRFIYRPRLIPMVLAFLLLSVCSAVFVQMARRNDRGLIINHAIELGVEGATIFFWCFAAVCTALVVAGLVALLQRLGEPKYLLVDDEMLTVPHRWTKGATTVRYADIRHVALHNAGGQDSLRLITATGKISIAALMLESKEVFQTVGELIRAHVERAGLPP